MGRGVGISHSNTNFVRALIASDYFRGMEPTLSGNVLGQL